MTVVGWIQVGVFALLVVAITRPLGVYMYRVFEGDRQPLPRVLGRIERLLLRACGLRDAKEQTWLQYAIAMLVFSAVTLIVTYVIERAQGALPWNPQHLPGVPGPLAFNTASSF